jgi:hypothetical protein
MIQSNTMTKEGYTIRDQTLPHFITAIVVDWIDVFTRKTYRDTVIECFDYCIANKSIARSLAEQKNQIYTNQIEH